MDSGLGTSERMHRRATVAAPTAPVRVDTQANPSILCRNCRVYLSLDDMETHECDPKDVKASNASSPRAEALLKAASRASSFLDSFLDTPAPGSPPPVKVATTSSTAQKTSESHAPVSVSRLAPKEQQNPVRAVETTASRKPLVPSLTPAPILSTPPVTPAVVVKVDPPPQPHRYESLSPSPQSPTAAETNKPEMPQRLMPTLANLGRSMSVMTPPPPPIETVEPTTASVTSPQRPRGQSSAGTPSLPVQCRVRGVRLNKDKVAVYSLVSNLLDQQSDSQSSVSSPTSTASKPNEIIVERRYREFHAFALAVYSMFPSQDLWQRLPPKTMCLPSSNHVSGGFLLRRKNGLDDFVRRALELMELGSSAQGSIGQWYLVRKFLNLPAIVSTAPNQQQQPTKDRSIVAATAELKKHACETTGWTVVGRADEHDTTWEKVSDGFHTVKRVKSCAFPARAIFDMITKRTGRAAGAPSTATVADAGTENGTEAAPGPAAVGTTGSSSYDPNVDAAECLRSENPQTGTESAVYKVKARRRHQHVYAPGPAVGSTGSSSYDPNVDVVECLRRENRQTWTERVVYKGRWTRPNLEMISLKTWKVDDNGSIVLVMIPADDSNWPEPSSGSSNRVDCILGGWIIAPVPGEETCSITWLMQANFGECDPRCEFTGSQSFTTAFIARSFLLTWADEITHLLTALEAVYEPVYYRNLGPLLSGGDFHKLKLERRDTTMGSAMEDPRVYVLAHELEPSACLLVHKSSNTNALIFMTNYARRAADKHQQFDLDAQAPLKAEWIMFEKPGNPRQELSTIEKNSTYSYSTRLLGLNVFYFRLELLKRDCVLRNDPTHGFALFTTINGKPNVLLKRVYLNYTVPTSRLSFASKLQEIHLFGDSEVEIMSLLPTATK